MWQTEKAMLVVESTISNKSTSTLAAWDWEPSRVEGREPAEEVEGRPEKRKPLTLEPVAKGVVGGRGECGVTGQSAIMSR